MADLPLSSSEDQNTTFSDDDSVSPNNQQPKAFSQNDKHQPATVSDTVSPSKKDTSTPDKHENVLFPPTKTKFGIIQREEERIGLPIHSQNKEFKKILKKDDVDHSHTTDVGVAKLVYNATESLLGVDVKVDASLSISDTNKDLPKHKHVHIEAMMGNLDANARAGFGLTGTGATAGITASVISAQIGPVSGNLGFGLTTGAFVSPTQVTVEVLGTGIKVGEQTGISIFGSSATINVGKLVEDTANHFVHHDPHQHIHDKVDKVKSSTEHALGIDVVKETVTVHVIEPGKKKMDESVITIKESVHVVKEEFKDSVHLVRDEWKEDLQLMTKERVHSVDKGSKHGVHT